MKILKSVLLGLVVGAMACAHTPENAIAQKPDWVSGDSVKYSRKNFLSAVGEGDTRQEAENQARLGVARFFETKIQSEVKEDSNYRGSSGTGKSDYQLDKTYSSQTKMVTDQILSGVEITEYFRDQVGRHYALAALNRMNALGSLKDKTDALDAKIAGFLGQVKSSETDSQQSALVNLRFYLQALPLVKERELYAKQIGVLSGSPSLYVAQKDYSQVEVNVQKILNEISVKVDISGEGSARIRDAIIASLNKSRFKVDPNFSGTPDILLKGEVNSQVVNRQDETWKWAKSEVVVDLVDGKNNQKFGQIRKSQREGSKDLRRARDLTLEKISEDLQGEVSEMVLEFLIKG